MLVPETSPLVLATVAALALLSGAAARSCGGEADPPPAPGTARPALTLAEACREAASGSDRIRAARLEAAAAHARRKQAAAAWWPQLEAGTRWLRSNDPAATVNFLLQHDETPIPTRSAEEDWFTQATVSFLVFDGGGRAAAGRAAAHGHSARVSEASAVHSRVLTATVETFVAALLAQEQEATCLDEQRRAEDRLELARTNRQAGRARDSEVLAAEYHLERARRDLAAARNSGAEARETLGRLLGRPGAVSGPLAEPAGEPLAAAEGYAGADAARQAAVESSPEIGAARDLGRAAEAAVGAARAGNWPRLEVFARYGFNDERFGRLDSDLDSCTLGASLTWTVFDGGLRRARLAEARQLAAAAQARARESELRASQAARSAARELGLARQSHDVARRSLALEEARLAEVRAAHQAGRAPLRELLDAEGARAAARMEEIRARHGLRLAAARLLDAVGYWVSWQ